MRNTAIACVLGSLAACSGGSSHSKAAITPPKTSTTSPRATTSLPDTPTGVREFFSHDGKPLIAFERATKPLTMGVLPERATCLRLTRDVLPKVIRDPNLLSPLTQRIPNRALAEAFGADVRLKILVVLGCSAGAQPLPPGSADPRAYTTVRSFADRVQQILAGYGIEI
jgi:hypothetical protein